MKKFSFKTTQQIRKDILTENKNKDSVFFAGNNNVLISVPHGVSQTRYGKVKVAEIGTIPLGKLLADATNSNVIIKTKNNFDDANKDEDCAYRKRMSKLIKQHNIKYIIDLHSLAKHRPCDINLGIHLGLNIKKDEQAYDKLVEMLEKDFIVSIDAPFMASTGTISGFYAKEFGLWTIQIETNCKILVESKEIKRFNQLANTLENWINWLNNR